MIRYKDLFKVYRRDSFETARKYVEGLLACEKEQANMERMEEEIIDSEYRAYQHFISNSVWDYRELISRIALDVFEPLQENKKKSKVPTGYIIDESSHLKKGKESVGVAKQYAGVAGKVDNCQFGVYCSLINDTRAALINEGLFLPESWTTSKSRCDKARIPQRDRLYKTKPELALEMIDKDIKLGVKFDWIGGDALYGHNQQLTKGLDERGLFYVLDVHKDELILYRRSNYLYSRKGARQGETPQ